MLIGLSGYAGSGKDAFGNVLVEKHGFKRVAFADKLREVALAIDPLLGNEARLSSLVSAVGWHEAKSNPEVRRLLQAIGCAVRDHVDTDAWVDAALADLDLENSSYVFTDMRFANEYLAVVESGGRVVRIGRPGVSAVNAHVSETALDGHGFDAYVENDRSLVYLGDWADSIVMAFGVGVPIGDTEPDKCLTNEQSGDRMSNMTETRKIAGTSERLTIERRIAGYAYPRNGNVHNPTPRYIYLLKVDGILVDQSSRERDLRQAAKSNGDAYISEIDAR